MFTIYIHILEVLAMHPQGVGVKVVVDMGGELITTERNAKSYLRDLKTQGFVSYQDKGDLWFITEKAIEYCETVVRRHDLSRYVNIVENVHYMVSGDYVFSIDEDGVPDHNYIGLVKDTGELPSDALPEKNAPKSHHEAITDVLDAPQAANLPEMSEPPHDDEYDDCAYCGKTFLARTSADNFYCDHCYSAGYHLPLDNDFDGPEDEAFDPADDFEAF